jgi:hypothetical protein
MGAAIGRRHFEHSPCGGAVQLSTAPFDPRAHRGSGQGLGLGQAKSLLVFPGVNAIKISAQVRGGQGSAERLPATRVALTAAQMGAQQFDKRKQAAFAMTGGTGEILALHIWAIRLRYFRVHDRAPDERIAMSILLWNKLPDGFLKMKYKRWARLDYDVGLLIIELADKQKFKCALCSRKHDLVVEHDHDPEHGTGEGLTIYNIRGLTCQRCNWHLMVDEKDRNGEYRGFDDAYSYVSDREYESYTFAYDCRVGALYEDYLKEKLGLLNYWRRRIFLDKFDDWKEWGARYPWHWVSMKSKTRDTAR